MNLYSFRTAASIKKTKKKSPTQTTPVTQTKFKIRCSRYLYTLVVDDVDKAEKLKASLPPGECYVGMMNEREINLEVVDSESAGWRKMVMKVPPNSIFDSSEQVRPLSSSTYQLESIQKSKSENGGSGALKDEWERLVNKRREVSLIGRK